MRTKHVHCAACGSEKLEKHLTCQDFLIGKESFEIDLCLQCGLLSTQPIIPTSEIGAYYESVDYVSHSNTQKGLFFKAYHWARQFMLSQKYRLVQKHHAAPGKHLDIGAGTGFFVRYMQDKGWLSQGIEISPEARAFARQSQNVTLSDPDLFYSKNTDVFDVVTLWHVLEHIANFKEVLAYIQKHLSSKGSLIIAVPNHQSYDAQHYQAFWAAYDVPRHLWHFSPQVLEEIGKKQGFALVEKKAMPLDTFYVSMLSEKYQGKKAYLPLGALKSAWFILKSIFNTDRSSSVIYVFKKA